MIGIVLWFVGCDRQQVDFPGPTSDLIGVERSLGEASSVVAPGPYERAYLGAAVAGGDVDGDGLSDLVLGAPGLYGAIDESGGAWLFRGGADFSTRVAFDEPDVRVDGAHAFGYAGETVAAGDLNGDAVADLLISDWGSAGCSQGCTHILLGPIAEDRSLASVEATIVGKTGYRLRTGELGLVSVGGLGGDDEGALLFQSHHGDAPDGTWTVLHLIDGPLNGAVDPGDVGAQIRVVTEDSHPDGVLASGDVDGDGAQEVLWGLPWEDEFFGFAQLYDGATLAALDGIVQGVASAVIRGDGETLYGVGYSGALPGDLDGDGYGEVVVSTAGLLGRVEKRGVIYVIPGSGRVGGEISLIDGGYTALYDWENWDHHGGPEMHFGATVTGLGDVDGDGLADLGTNRIQTPGSEGDLKAGVWVIPGAGLWSAAGGLHDAATVGAFFSEPASYFVGGYEIAGAGDVDGDGLDDVLVGDQNESTYGDRAGAAYLLLGADL